MLFAYTYVPHQMEKMQEFIDFIFYDVWCKAPVTQAYSLDLYHANPDLRDVMTSFYYADSQGADFFSSNVERIYNLFALLNQEKISQLRLWYKANNDIESICMNNPEIQVLRYQDFPADLSELHEQIAGFFKKLYSNLDIAALKEKVGDIDNHYQTFMRTNKVGKCPFCGINDILGVYHSKREAYDHYLPKAIYPFNSINFKNLVPACHHCNSSYKTSKDPAYTPKDPTRSIHRRAFFYPYTLEYYEIDIHVDLLKSDIKKLEPTDIILGFGPEELSEQIETWNDVYGIEERYKAKLCNESDGKYWLTQVLDEWSDDEDGRDPDQFLRTLTKQTHKNPFAECNFLKKPFLDACKNIGLFETIPAQPGGLEG